ncbi:MAG: hypothetical protein EOP04_08900 [Proteobacteria bacterium]|nr:MAG: hypothetical protein EOP04_08900 [Pseudomonadota bacterium]
MLHLTRALSFAPVLLFTLVTACSDKKGSKAETINPTNPQSANQAALSHFKGILPLQYNTDGSKVEWTNGNSTLRGHCVSAGGTKGAVVALDLYPNGSFALNLEGQTFGGDEGQYAMNESTLTFYEVAGQGFIGEKGLPTGKIMDCHVGSNGYNSLRCTLAKDSEVSFFDDCDAIQVENETPTCEETFQAGKKPAHTTGGEQGSVVGKPEIVVIDVDTPVETFPSVKIVEDSAWEGTCKSGLETVDSSIHFLSGGEASLVAESSPFETKENLDYKGEKDFPNSLLLFNDFGRYGSCKIDGSKLSCIVSSMGARISTCNYTKQ